MTALASGTNKHHVAIDATDLSCVSMKISSKQECWPIRYQGRSFGLWYPSNIFVTLRLFISFFCIIYPSMSFPGCGPKLSLFCHALEKERVSQQ